MVIKLFDDLVAAEGEPLELAMYTHTLLEIFKLKSEYDREKKEMEIMGSFGDLSILDLIRSEMMDNAEQKDEKNDGGNQNDRT